MIRIIALLLALTTPATAQDLPDLPDVNIIRADPRLDMSWVPPLGLQQAIAAAEDPSWFDTFPATSTITRQIAKNYLLSAQRTILRRTMEIRLAVDIANAYTPDEIMSIYAQRIYLGRGCYGVPAGIEHLFAKQAEDATLRDFITLAAVFKGPSSYDRDPDWLPLRYAFVVREGETAGFWPQTVSSSLLEAGPTPMIDGSTCPFALE